MELKIAAAGEWRPTALGGSSGVHRDILEGRDCEIGWEDVFTGELMPSIKMVIGTKPKLTILCSGNELREVPDFHAEIENKMKMNW